MPRVKLVVLDFLPRFFALVYVFMYLNYKIKII